MTKAGTRAKAKPKARPATKASRKPAAKAKAKAAPKKAKAQAAPKKAAPKKAAPKKAAPKAKSAGKAKGSPASVRATSSQKWLAFVEKHGVVLASAKGPVPNLADEVAGEPIIGSWWSHPKGQQIYEILSAVDEDVDVRCFKLVDGKVTFVHRRVWPALVRLARDGVLSVDRVAEVQQEHMESGEHRNFTMPFPTRVPDETAKAADALTTEQARAQLGGWV